MKIIVLASGSKGNATYIETKHSKLLIDAGISFRQMKLKLLEHQINIETLDAVLLTHEHSDHAKGLPTLLKYTRTMLYTLEDTFNHLYHKTTYDLSYTQFSKITQNQSFRINDLKITPIPVSHDAVSTVGFILEENDTKLVYMTDVGYLPTEDYPKIENATGYIFEANYDVSLLFSSARPYYLKKRIDSISGHLSNADSAYHLSRVVGEKTKLIILAHPSDECNTEHHVMTTLLEVFNSYAIDVNRFEIIVAKQQVSTKMIEI
ncbi:MBL fold metallo-hydrolase [Liberiplasma polymorphum]|uniref:MBL fold metallo-hydrolase n=1 Tax=Liberiplasma polymorphum TaxID=3374570 RepID=UPI003775B188